MAWSRPPIRSPTSGSGVFSAYWPGPVIVMTPAADSRCSIVGPPVQAARPKSLPVAAMSRSATSGMAYASTRAAAAPGAAVIRGAGSTAMASVEPAEPPRGRNDSSSPEPPSAS